MRSETQFLEDCPGVVGIVAREIDAALPYSEPQISLGTAFSVVGALKAGHYSCAEIHCHAYHGIIARAGLGKTIAQDLAIKICNAAEQPELITGDSTSEAGLISALDVSPRRLIIMDELGRAFEQMGLDKGGYRQELLSVLLKLYSCANGVYHGKNYANKEPVVIHRPLVSMLGGSTPHAFFAGMTPRLAHDGMLSRFFLWFASGASTKLQETPFQISTSIVQELAEIRLVGASRGNLKLRVDAKQVAFTSPAFFKKTCQALSDLARAKSGDLESALYARLREQFIKLSITLCDKKGVVREPDLEYACDLLRFLYAQSLDVCMRSLGAGARELSECAYSDRIFAFISEQCAINNDGKVLSSVVSREFRSGKARQIAIDELIEQERIFVLRIGRTMKLYSTVPNDETFQDTEIPQKFPRNSHYKHLI